MRMRKKGKNTNQNGKNIGFEGDYVEEFLRGGEKKREREKGGKGGKMLQAKVDGGKKEIGKVWKQENRSEKWIPN